MPNTGMSKIGSSEVAGMGMASVAHQTAINSARPAADQAVSDMPPGVSEDIHAHNAYTPGIRPILALRADAGSSLVDAILGLSPKSQPAFSRVHGCKPAPGCQVAGQACADDQLY